MTPTVTGAMRRLALVAVLLVNVPLLAVRATTSKRQELTVTPIQKVVEMLNDMVAKGIEERKQEQIQMAAFKQFCVDTDRQKVEAIDAANLRIEELEGEIAKAEADVVEAGKKIAALSEDIGNYAKEKQNATEVRDKEHADFQATHKDYSESLDALERAIMVLKQQSKDVPQSALLQKDFLSKEMAMLQDKAKMMPDSAKETIQQYLGLNLMQQAPEGLAVAAPEANAYESQSSGVIEMLEQLRRKFRDEMKALENEETDDLHTFQNLVQRLTDQTELAEQESEATAKFKTKREQDAADAKGDLESTTKTRDDDKKYLDDLRKMCQQKAADFDERQKLRAEEIEVIKQAIGILTSDKVAGTSGKNIRPEDAAVEGTSLVQLHSFLHKAQDQQKRRRRDPKALEKVQAFLKARAKKADSHVLAALATKMNIGDTAESRDAFAKVKKMIQELIVRLMEEANNEAEHKGWCDTELATNKQTREMKSADVDTLTARIEELQAEATSLTEDLADLANGIAEIDKAVATATEERQAEKEKNAQTVKEADEGQVAVTQALAVLRDFYAKAAEATAFMQLRKQSPAEDAPATFDSAYTGQTGSGGVVAMLEVIVSDFNRLSQETKAAEEAAETEYTQFMADSSRDKALKQTESDHKDEKLTNTKTSIDMSKRELATLQEELDAALEYYEKLKPSCIDTGVSFEERNAQRQEEIQSLQEALSILGDDTQDLSDSKYASMTR